TMTILVSDNEHEEPCEGRLSRTVLWEGRGEIPLPDPIMGKFKKRHKVMKQTREPPQQRFDCS
ncbi:MAG: hypothetical protein ACK500_08960, partial [Flavobacteriales bacterium]